MSDKDSQASAPPATKTAATKQAPKKKAPKKKVAKTADSQKADAPSEEKAPVSPADEWAENEVAKMRPAKAPKGISEADIKAKMKAGLSRKQAIEVLEAQAAHDAKLKASTKGKG